MALQSPGVQVTVIDESFYTPAEPGTTPLIVVATGQDKVNGAGTGTASATTKANAGKAFKLTSQRDLVDLFGVPFFEKTASSTPIHGSERNEYGLLAAYSLLGVSNAAFIVRADVDLDQLEAQSDAPGANPDPDSWWVDTTGTLWGIQEWNGTTASGTGQRFTTKIPTVFTDSDAAKLETNPIDATWGRSPKGSIGVDGDYAVVFETGAGNELPRLFFKRPLAVGGGWVLVGSEEWTASWPAVSSGATVTADIADLSTKQWYINNTMVTGSGATVAAFLTNLVGDINTKLSSQGVSARVVNSRLYLYTEGKYDGDSTTSEAIYLENGTGGSGGDWDDLEITVDSGSGTATYYGPRLVQSPHTQVPLFKATATNTAPRPSGSLWIKTTSPNSGSDWIIKKWDAATTSWVEQDAPLYASTHAADFGLDRTGGGTNIGVNSLFVQYSASEYDGIDPEVAGRAEWRIWRRAVKGATSITSATRTAALAAGAKTFTIIESVVGSQNLNSVTITTAALTGTTGAIATDFEKIAKAINDAAYDSITDTGLKHVEASYDEDLLTFTITHKAGGEIRIVDSTPTALFGSIYVAYNVNTNVGTDNFYAAPDGSADNYDYLVSSWKPLATEAFEAKADAPENEPQDGQLWYNPTFADVDIMIHNGETWVGYRDAASPYADNVTTRDGFTPSVAASNPWKSGSTLDGDLWISTADLENFPTIYRYDNSLTDLAASERWVLVDKTDQTSEEGVLFADARYNTTGANSDEAGTIADLAKSNYVDPDAPDPALYPRGMLLWNLRRSGGNVKRYVNNYITTTERNPRFDNTNSPNGDTFVTGESMSSYATDRWVTASPNNEDGSGSFGRKAQRAVVVAALKSAVDTSAEIRDEERRNFNLISCPGYPELMSNLVNLNIDRGITAFVVGDTPLRLPADATSLTNWGTNANLVTDNGDDGIVTYDEYLATFYPNGFTTDLSGSNAVVPASHMMLRTIALSDNVSFPWFAPAGTRRGGITNATAVGYIDSATGEFQTVALNEGQRDTLYDLKINPIPFFNGVGLVNYGQKTRARNASALDRINVARLVVYLRSQLNKLARPYIFEPNDKITRDEIKQSVESLLLELVGLRALYDFAVVCDESNNTPARIDRNELYVDIAIEPVKAVEFIYIPLRVKNTGEI
jgi:hypothetical protein